MYCTIIATLARGGDYAFSAPSGADTVHSVGRFEGATGFAVSPAGMYYVLLGGSDELLRLTEDGTTESRIGGYGWGGDRFDGPSDISVPNDLEVYISDYGNDRIVKLDRSLGVASVFETTGEKATFRFPLSVCVTAAGRVLVLDGEFGRVVEIDRDNRISRIFGGRGSGPGSLDHPVRIRTDGDSVIIVGDRSGLVVYDIFGNYLRTLDRSMTGEYQAFDCGNGSINLLDSARVRTYSMSGVHTGTFAFPVGPGMSGERVVDLNSLPGRLFLLTPTRIFRFDGDIPRGDQ